MGVTVPPNIIIVDSNSGQILNTFLDTSSSNENVRSESRHGEYPAYVLYTSGSTGTPKGVMVLNKGVTNIIKYFEDILQVTPNDVVLGLTTFCFDISVLEMFLPLTVGATLVLTSAACQKNPVKILQTIKKYKVNIMQATPTTYEMILSTGWRGDPKIVFLVGGEACRPSVVQLASNCKRLLNVYGPTETTIWSSCYEFPSNVDSSAKVIPIGIYIYIYISCWVMY